MEKFVSVRDLLALIYDDDCVEIDFPGFSSGVIRCSLAADVLSPEQLAGRVTGVWRSLYNKIVIEAEVIA